MITYEYRLPHDINSFRRSVGWYELSPRQLNCALKSSVFAITALDGEKEVGSARVVGDGGYQFFISDVIVRPEYQGQGIGQMIIESLINYVEEIQLPGTRIMLDVMCAVGRENFYKKFGFIARPTDKLGPGMIKYIDKQ